MSDCKNRIYSYSQINTFTSCPELFKISYLDKIRKKDESIEAYMGKRVHESLEWLYLPENNEKLYVTFDKLVKVYDTLWLNNWHDKIFIADRLYTTDYYYSIGKRCLANYYNKYGPAFDQSIVNTEKEFEFKVDEFSFKGIVDRIDHDGNGNWSIHDYKTGKRAKTARQAVSDFQLALYHIALTQHEENIKSIELIWHYLRTYTKVSIFHNDKSIEELTNKIVKKITKVNYACEHPDSIYPRESMLCNWCYYWEECSAKPHKNPVKQAV
jgi:putative RecB family exonuclease